LEYSLVKCYNSIMCACGILYFSIRNTNRYLLLIGACALLLYSKGPVVLRDHTNCIYGVATNVCRRKWGSWCFGRKLDSEDGRERSERPSRSPTCAWWRPYGWQRGRYGSGSLWAPKTETQTENPNLPWWTPFRVGNPSPKPKPADLRSLTDYEEAWDFLPLRGHPCEGIQWGLGESVRFFIPL
jgi:hypothetical protein